MTEWQGKENFELQFFGFPKLRFLDYDPNQNLHAGSSNKYPLYCQIRTTSLEQLPNGKFTKIRIAKLPVTVTRRRLLVNNSEQNNTPVNVDFDRRFHPLPVPGLHSFPVTWIPSHRLYNWLWPRFGDTWNVLASPYGRISRNSTKKSSPNMVIFNFRPHFHPERLSCFRKRLPIVFSRRDVTVTSWPLPVGISGPETHGRTCASVRPFAKTHACARASSR